MKIFNTLTNKKEDFIPLLPNEVKIYACGVTVYDHSHIGHARSAVFFDVLRRYLQFKGFTVTYVRNFTDIDDKIINRARQEHVSWDTIARQYTEEYYNDMGLLGVAKADIEPKATDHMKEIIDIVASLIEKGYAYEVNGNVYFAVNTFSEYGKLSKRDIEEMTAGARVDVDERKQNPMDFALWKQSKEGEPSWESPWGPGRPGWHIECTAMSIKHLGMSFDIHGGGADLIFPHHENEIAQSEAFTGKPFAKYWIHNGFITIDKEKMSKSLGNFFTVKEVLDKFDPEAVRFFLLSTHYRSPIEFSDAPLRDAERSIDRYYTTVLRINDFISQKAKGGKGLSNAGETLQEFTLSFRKKFVEAMDDDFNTALAIGHMFELIRAANAFLDTKPSSMEDRALLLETKELIQETGDILNILNKTPDAWYRSLIKIKMIDFSEKEILEGIENRQHARKNKDWDTADRIRKELEEKGIILEDKKTGQTGKSRSDSDWIYGINPVMEALRAGRKIKKIFLSSSRRYKALQIIQEAEKSNIPLTISDPAFFDHKFSKGHQGIAASVYPNVSWSLQELLEIPVTKNEAALFLILDCIEDARNFGALLRVADAAGIHGVVVQSHRSVTLNPLVSKVSAGAVEYVPVSVVPNIKHAIYEMKERGITIIGTDVNAEQTVWDSDFKEPLALIIGSEGKGLRKTVRTLCDVLISIPMKGSINSLNVSVATGIFVFEIMRHRLNIQ